MQNNFAHTADFSEQTVFSKRVKELAFKLYKNPKACVITFGCQQNVSDSERLKGMLFECGYQITDNMDEADFIIFNTCAVREHAEMRVFGNVGMTKRIKAEKPDTIVAVCGCMVQQEHIAEKLKKSYPYVDIVMGTHVFHRLPEFLYKRLSGSPRIFELSMDNNTIVRKSR